MKQEKKKSKTVDTKDRKTLEEQGWERPKLKAAQLQDGHDYGQKPQTETMVLPYDAAPKSEKKEKKEKKGKDKDKEFTLDDS